jgi:hypothetical protein
MNNEKNEASERPTDAEKYGWALQLIQFEVQRHSLVFGTFLLVETVLLGALVSAFKDGSEQIFWGGAVIGILLVIVSVISTVYLRSFFLLRIEQAKRFEDDTGFITQGQLLYEGGKVGALKINALVRFFRPARTSYAIMIAFAIAFAGTLALKIAADHSTPPIAGSHYRHLLWSDRHRGS